jgi:6-phosphogluconate dehydrogenase
MRQISAQKATRQLVAEKLGDVGPGSDHGRVSLDELRSALFCAFIITYAQGLAVLQAASKEKGYGLDLAGIARIWRGGCIIRSTLLEEIRSAYAANADLASLLLDDSFAGFLGEHADALRRTVTSCVSRGIPAMCFSSVLAYLDAFRTERLPANLIQAQRDHFGAHTYQRIDREGTFHTPDW